MAFDFSTLVTDRAMADVLARNDKGTYNAADLNRVDECLEDLVARLGQVGCNVPGYERVKIPRETKPVSRLPGGYTELEYIQSSGTQYMDSGLALNKSDSYTYSILAQFSNDAYGGANSYMQFMSGIASGAKATIKVVYDGETHVERVYVDDTQKSQTDWTSTYSGVNVKIGILKMGDQNNGWFSGTPQIGKIFALTILNGEKLIRDFVPCIDPTEGVGLYDLVDGKFYGNAGAGVFLAGPPKVTLPEGYTQVEYIESSGTQRIDTGFQPNQNSRVLIDAEILSKNSGSDHHIGTVLSNSNYWTLRLRADRTGFAARYDGRRLTNLTHTGNVFARHFFDHNKNVVRIDGGTATTFAAATWSATANLPIFCYTDSGTKFSSYTSMRLYLHEIYDNGTLVRFFIPCKNAAGAVGLYDLVGQKFYGNAGTGSFAAGPVVTWDTPPEEPTETLDPYTWYESDVPSASQMAQYRGNVAAVRAVLQLPNGTTEPPGTMEQLTTAGANNIEAVLLAVDLILNHIPAAVRHCGVTVCGSKGVIA